MHLPFTTEQFFDVFRQYNESIWPLQVLFYVLAVFVIIAASKKNKAGGKFISAVLAFFWIWMGAVYHLVFFYSINKAALFFGAVFILQGLIFFYEGLIKNNLEFQISKNVYGITGALLVVFALVIYPVLGALQEHIYPSAPLFGLPCPTTIFTFGVLLWSIKKIPFWTWFIPFVWSLIGFSAATRLGVREDTGLLVAGLLASVLLLGFRPNK